MADTALSYSIFAKDKTSAGLRSAGAGFEKLGGIGKKVFAGLALAGGAGAAVGFAKGLIEDARESARVGRLTEAVIKSTGGAAKVTADQVGDLATAISNKTGADDEAIQSGQNLLLTFTNVKNGVGKGNQIFNEASQTITDMTAALNGGDVSAEKIKGSAIQLGKALNDPVKGVGALSKVGVSFTEGQKRQIATMVKAGDTMGAQKVILGELKKEFGGAAAAASDPAQKAAVAWGNLREQLGGYLLPAFGKLMTFVSSRLVPGISKFFENVQHGGGAFASVREKLGQFSGFIQGTVLPALRRFGAWFMAVALPAIQRFAAAFWRSLQPAIKQIAASIQTQMIPALQLALAKFREAWPTIQRVALILGTVAQFILTKVVPVLIQLYAKYLATLIRTFAIVFSAVWRFIGVLIDLGIKIGEAGAAFGRFVSRVSSAMGGFVRAVADGIGRALQFYRNLPGNILSAIGNLGSLLYNAGKDVIKGLIHGIEDAVPGLKGALNVVTKLIPLHKGPPAKDRALLRPAGRSIIGGLIGGMKERFPDVKSALEGLTQQLQDKLDTVKDFAKQIRDAFRSAADPTSFDTGEDKSFGGLLAKLQQQRDAAKEFASGMAQLRKQGLNEITLGQLRDAGPSGGLPSVQALLGGDVNQVNSLVRDIDQTGAGFGNREAKSKFGIDPSRKQVIELRIEGGGDDLTNAIVKALRGKVRGQGGNVQIVLGGSK